MSWRTYLGDTTSGLIDRPIDIPSFTWSITVSDSALATSKDKNIGDMEYSGITVPWTAIKEKNASARSAALSSLRRCLTLFWNDGYEDVNGFGIPILWGAIGSRTDTWVDTSFDLLSVKQLLANRIVIKEKQYGIGVNGTSPGSVRFDNLSYRGIASALVNLCTNEKPGGALPITLPYLNEKGNKAREYKDYDIQNNVCSDLLDNLANLLGGPDLQFRPYMPDQQHIRLNLLGGSDADVYLGQNAVHTLTCFPGGGTLQNITVDHASPVMRVYSSGSGTDAAQLCYLAENLNLVRESDPWPLVEQTYSDSDTDNLDVLKSHANAHLEGGRLPLMQISGEVDFSDVHVPKPGAIWPGEQVNIVVDGFPSLPDGVYECRLMEMSGDQTTVAKLKFDVMDDPVF